MEKKKKVTRRKFLKAAGAVGLWLGAAASSLLEACSPKPTPTSAPPEAPTPTPVPSEAPTPTPVPPTAAPAVVPSVRKDLVVGLFGEPDHLNEFNKVPLAGGILTKSNIQNRLVRCNYETGELEPELAVEWAPIDPTTWRIKLREGVQWHKGYGEFTAEDVEYNWNYQIENEKPITGSGLSGVERAKAVDRYVVEVKLKSPWGVFVGMAMEYAGVMLCKKAHEEMGEEEYGRNPIGTGPFVFDSWVSGSHMVLKKNPNYWREGLPHLEELTFRFVPDPGVRLAMLRKGEIDWMDHPEAKDVPDVRAGKYPGIVLDSSAGWNWDYMSFTFPPHNSPDFPTAKSQEVRQAISYAVDRQAIVDTIYLGEATVTDSPIPPGYLAYRPGPLKYPATADLDTAKELMIKGGYPDGFEIECITSDKDWLRRETEIVADQLSKIGIKLKIQGLDAGTFRERWFGKQNEMILEDISIVAPDPDACIWHFVHPDTSTYQGYPNTQVHDWVDEARENSDQAKREELYHNAVDQVLEDCPFIYICHVNIVRLRQEGLTGIKVARLEDIMQLDWAQWEA